ASATNGVACGCRASGSRATADVVTSQEAPLPVAAVVLADGCPSLLLFRSSGSRGFIGPASDCRLHEARRLGRGAGNATGRRPLRAAPQASVRLLGGSGQRVDERRELVLELLDRAGTPAVGQVDRHRVGEDLLFTTLDAVEDPLRDRLRSRLRRL